MSSSDGLKEREKFLKLKKNLYSSFKSKNFNKEFVGKSNSIFVGSYNYPDVNLGILSAENYNYNDDINFWVKNNLSISNIAEKRFNLINSKKPLNVSEASSLSSEQEIALSKREVQVEMSLDKVSSNFNFSSVEMPTGPSATLKNFNLVENSKIPTKVESIISDDLTASDMLLKLNKSFETSYLVQALSSGSLGFDKKLVPTKWPITAVDSLLSKNLKSVLKDNKLSGNFIFRGDYLGNYFLILFLEGPISFELMEFYNGKLVSDFEGINDSGNSAKNTKGAFYASKLSVFEYMKEQKIQSQVIILRFITDEYYLPLGVWVVREGVKKVFETSKINFSDETLLYNFVKIYSKKKFNIDLSNFEKLSDLIKNRSQKTLSDF